MCNERNEKKTPTTASHSFANRNRWTPTLSEFSQTFFGFCLCFAQKHLIQKQRDFVGSLGIPGGNGNPNPPRWSRGIPQAQPSSERAKPAQKAFVL